MPITEPPIDNLTAMQYTIQAVTTANDVQTPAAGTLALYAIGSTIYSMNSDRVSVTQTPLSGNVIIGTTSGNTLTVNATTSFVAPVSFGSAANIAVNTNKFTVAASSGNTAVGGTLAVTGAASFTSTVDSAGNFSVATNKLTVAAASGNTAIAGTLAVTGASTFTGLVTVGSLTSTVNLGSAIVAVTAGATPSINAALSNVFSLTPLEDETISATNIPATGQVVRLIILTSGTTSRTLTFSGTNFIPNGTLATGTSAGKTFVVQFLSNGTKLVEISRTTAL